MTPRRSPVARRRTGHDAVPRPDGVAAGRPPGDAFAAVLVGLALGASFIEFRLFVVPWLALVPLVALTERVSPRRALALGAIVGTVGIGLAFSWLVYAMRVFGGFSLPLSIAISAAPVLAMALEFGVFMALTAWIGPLPLGLTAPLAFTVVEFLYPSLFPWRLAHSQYRVPLLLQTGELAGPYLLTFTMVWSAVGLLAALRLALRRRLPSLLRGDAAPTRAAVAAPLLLLLVVVVYGAWRLPVVRAARLAAPALDVGVVQGNVGVDRKGDRSFFTRNLADYRELSRQVADRVDLLIWPETVVQQRLSIAGTRLALGADPYPDAPRPLLFGGLAIDPRVTPPLLYNSAFLVTDGGRIAGRYDKRVLVPFGEYMPLGNRFPALRAMSPATGNFAAGTSAAVLDVSPLARLGCLICYEDVIPGPARQAVAAGATLLVNLTNDAWYGDGAEPVQHQALAVWRAVENRRDLVRSTNTGLTAIVSATGEVLGELPTFEAATLVREVRLLSAGPTVYGTAGDAFSWMLVAALAAVIARRIASSSR